MSWLARARAAADAPPLRPREALHVETDGGLAEVGSVERAVAERMRDAGLPVAEADGGGWRVRGPATASLERIAAWLREAGLAGGWRDELLDVVDAEKRSVAVVERGVVRALGLTTFAVHLAGRSFDGRGAWVQQRALDKATDPGLWDTLMGGQIGAGESVESALQRETWEEAGLDVAALLDLGRGPRMTIRRPVAEGYMVEHLEVFHARLAAGSVPVNQDGEVARFECFDEATLAAALARGEFTLEASLILAA